MSAAAVVITVSAGDAVRRERRGEPVAIGVAFPRGELQAGPWALLDQSQRPVPVQATILDRWGDQSIRWLLVEFGANVGATGTASYSLVAGSPSPPETPLEIASSANGFTVNTGPATFEVPNAGTFAIATARTAGRSGFTELTIDAEDGDGRRYRFAIRRPSIERTGPLAAVIHLDGDLVDAAGSSWLQCNVRLRFHAGLGAVDVEVSCTNPRAAQHPDGLWDLGDPGSVLIRDLSVRLQPAAGSSGVSASIEGGSPIEPAGGKFTLYQDSSGGVNWQSANHVNRLGEVPATFRGFRAVADGKEITGLRATPVVTLGEGASRISIAAPLFWQVFPKSLALSAEGCVIGVLPRDSSDLHELQGGERTTFSFVINIGEDRVSSEPLAWARSPLSVSVDPAVYQRAGVWTPVTVGSEETRQAYHDLVQSIVDGDGAFSRRREVIDEYGWRHFGEIYADHEAVNEAGLISHYNNQYDAIAGMATRFAQTGDRRWWQAMSELAAHVTDIDLYHTSRDRAAYNGGYFWHTQHYHAAATGTHRAYSRRAVSSGGGPSAEHNYSSGLLLHYFLTGNQRSRAAVVQLADWVIDMDDGRKSRFRWIDRRDTGHASGTRSPDFHGPGRGAGNSINALLDAHRLTGEGRYLEKAEQLIARCSHPDDDQDALGLPDAENRWSYTVFLQVLGKYLDYKADRDSIDQPFAYAREVLLNYARWMAQHERPYLERPERLEFPTETWAAQDIRKAAVFEFAARNESDDRQQALFRTRATDFFDYAVTAIQEAPTGRLVRPLVLLLAYGFQRPMTAARAGVTAPPAVRRSRRPFVPQRRRVVRLLALAGAMIIGAVIVAVALLIVG